jgi:hypothetical protein
MAKNSETINIDPRYLGKIRALSREHSHMDIRTDCMKRQKELAIERGEEEEAVMAHDRLYEGLLELKAAHEALWTFIHETHPECSVNGNWNLNLGDGTLEERDVGDMIGSALGKAFAMRGGR